MSRLLLASAGFTQAQAHSYKHSTCMHSTVACTCERQGDHVMRDIMAYQKRLKKEYEELSKRAPVGVSLDDSTMEDNVDV